MTRFLLDTCTLIDWAIDPSRLRDDARIAIANPRSIVFVSAISGLEIAIKRQLGKLSSPTDLSNLLSENRFLELAVTIEHAEAVNLFPLLHKDPFDRLLIAQTRTEKLTLITRDREILKYEVPTIAA